ncbi:hypothetical protein EV426DRAFT_641186 [Tirmania nivea]|nr:hypothetical protein EV426DRAFT_641186 [Tirmania nivea]
MSLGDSLDDFPFEGTKRWYLDNLMNDDGQTPEQFNRAFNFSLEPDEALDFELEPAMYTGNSAFTKRHTTPDFGMSPISPSFHPARSAHPVSTSPKRAETYPSIIAGLNIARSKKLIDNLLSKFDPETTPPSSESGSEPSDTRNVAQSLQVNSITDLGCDEWPVPTFFLDNISPPPGELDRSDNLIPEDPVGSTKPFGNIQSKVIEDNETNDYCSMSEDVDSVPPLNSSFGSKSGPYFKVSYSDSGIGSSTIVGSSYRHTLSKRGGGSSRDSQAKGSVMFDKASVSASTTAGIYQQVAAKLGPLTSAASSTAGSVETPRILSETALKTMKTIILEPILKNNKFHDFWDICRMAGEQMESGQIGSLRDLEKFLFHKASNIKNNQAYNNFCKEFLNHVRESLKYMPQNELLRPYDRPYDTGYFLDTLAPFLKSTMQSTVFEFSQEEENPESDRWLDSMASQLPQPEKRVAEADTAHGSPVKRFKPNRPGLLNSMAVTQGYPNDGSDNLSALSDSATQEMMTTISGIPDPMGPLTVPGSNMKPVSSNQYSKNKTRHRGRAQQVKEQQMFPCVWPCCSYPPFTRACDLTKHEKTHTRPYKCKVETCKYATEGFPTEKERDRHGQDKHSLETPAFHCRYPPPASTNLGGRATVNSIWRRLTDISNGAKRQSLSPSSPEGQESPMGASPRQQQFVTQPPAMASHYSTTDLQDSMNHGFCQAGRDFTTFEGLFRSIQNENTGSQDTFMFGGNQEHPNSTVSFGHQAFIPQGPAEVLPYPDDMDPRYVHFPPMPDENIDPSLQMMDVNIGGRMNLNLDDTYTEL